MTAMQGSDESMTAVDFVQVCICPQGFAPGSPKASGLLNPACLIHGAQKPTVMTTASGIYDPPITQEDARRYREALEDIAEQRVLVMDDLGETVADALVALASHALHPEAER